jgi:histidinol-phosphate aminotransferase
MPGPTLKSGAAPRSARQGGDVRDLPEDAGIDLSTCVNRYGPPPGVESALKQLNVRELRTHPFGVEQEFLEGYAHYLDVDPALLVAGRGISEFIRILARLLEDESVAVITPDYTDTIASFPKHFGPPDNLDTPSMRLDRLLRAMASSSHVMLSNPNNPSGIYISSGDLIEACRQYPSTTLIVDEAFIDFVATDRRSSMVQAEIDNLVVLRSPNKLFGITGVRTGALYTRNTQLRRRIEGMTPNWPLSYIDVRMACAAIEDLSWAARTRKDLLATARKMEALIRTEFPAVIAGVPVHYRFIPTREPAEAERYFLRRGVVVRTFSESERGRIPGVRVVAPTKAEFERIAPVLGAAATPLER